AVYLIKRSLVSKTSDLFICTATELEFWVKTPSQVVSKNELSTSQKLQEQYWQRTHGAVRTALEEAVLALNAYGLEAEMGHKEVGGVKGKIDDEGHMDHVLEQLEIDWKYTGNPLQTADNELVARIIVREVFRKYGLDVTFQAKPIIGVAGSGEHTHFGLMAKMKSGKMINLFSPADMRKAALSSIGLGAIMGVLKNYEVMNPFISSTTDSLNRLKPGFEAPICIVTSFGEDPSVPSRNRTILCGLIRDIENPMATRFELRSPNPYTNTYTAIALIYSAVLDGLRYVLTSGKSYEELLAEISKAPEAEADYLEKGRAYRSEKDVFDDYTVEERNAMFGMPPATVWENILGYRNNPEKAQALASAGAFATDLMDSFIAGVINRWTLELTNRIVPSNLGLVRAMKAAHETNAFDDARWEEVNRLRLYLAKDSVTEKSLFTRIIEAVAAKDYDTASILQVEMGEKMAELEAKYFEYSRNLI
uniref:glutamine synthetase n=1 Tax=uncultured Veillonella sp. TaxID=159268 RepID=UPI00261A8BC3